MAVRFLNAQHARRAAAQAFQAQGAAAGEQFQHPRADDPRAERIPQKGAWLFANPSPYSLGHEVRRGRQIGPYRCGISVARQIDRDQGVRRRQQFAEAAPEASRQRESVQQDQRRSRSAHLYMEWHDR